jgi:hypothetical protein
VRFCGFICVLQREKRWESITRIFRRTSTYEPVHRSPFSVPPGTPSSSIGVVPSNIASGCDSAFAVNPGLKPRGYIPPSLAGFCSCPEQDYVPFHPLSQSPPRSLTLSAPSMQRSSIPGVTRQSIVTRYQIHCVTGRCQRQRRDRYCNSGIYPGGMTCPQTGRGSVSKVNSKW